MKETGTVKFFNEAKGFGFLKNAQNKDFFVHASSLNSGTLNEGQRVEFDTREGKKGMEAFNVKVLD
jgi:CspA family cold shock protein